MVVSASGTTTAAEKGAGEAGGAPGVVDGCGPARAVPAGWAPEHSSEAVVRGSGDQSDDNGDDANDGDGLV